MASTLAFSLAALVARDADVFGRRLASVSLRGDDVAWLKFVVVVDKPVFGGDSASSSRCGKNSSVNVTDVSLL